jgi:hypothetical protein
MTLDEIQSLPFVKTYELDREPADLDDLLNVSKECQKHTYTTQLYIPVGEGGFGFHPYGEMSAIQEKPLVFSVQGDDVTDYGVVQGTALSVYRDAE